jgi:hypothetical protein
MAIEWSEVNCLIEALVLLEAKHKVILADPFIDEDTRSDHVNDLAYVEILMRKYEQMRDKIGIG